MVGDPEEAKDVMQDAFIQAFTHIGKLKNEITFSAWLKRIVVNNCINHLKKQRLMTAELNENIDLIDNQEDEFEEFKKENIAHVLSAIDKISEGCRVVLNLYLFEGYDHKEIGEILNISVSASKAQYSKAKAKIRTLLQDERR
jgi:RNA polymerase sigma-70 factor (ECF subfamily)